MQSTDDDVARIAATVRRGCIVAAAGCGKTEQIAHAAALSSGKRLILTHTHAGIDALSSRLKRHGVPAGKYRLDTIAGWCLRYSSTFPKRSGLDISIPLSEIDWDSVYLAAARLIKAGAAGAVLHASYTGIFVDEYQDCSQNQHAVIRLLAEELPCCVFGDPLQGIFNFAKEVPVDWEIDVYPAFPKTGELTIPWRWKNAGNEALAEWLSFVRSEIEVGRSVDLSQCPDRPTCIANVTLPSGSRMKQATITKECFASLKSAGRDGRIVILAKAASEEIRAEIAKQLAKRGFSNIEPINCKSLASAAERIDQSQGFERFKALIDFAGECMTQTEKIEFKKAVESHRNGGRWGKTKFRELLPLATMVIESGAPESMEKLLAVLCERKVCSVYRRELLFAMCSGLRMIATCPGQKLAEAVADVQIRIRHIGRRIGRLSVGSTLLVKGLEFEHSIICHEGGMDQKNWYVALTRATKTIRILSVSSPVIPSAQPRPSVAVQSSFVFPD